jgi:hypothetical protein
MMRGLHVSLCAWHLRHGFSKKGVMVHGEKLYTTVYCGAVSYCLHATRRNTYMIRTRFQILGSGLSKSALLFVKIFIAHAHQV